MVGNIKFLIIVFKDLINQNLRAIASILLKWIKNNVATLESPLTNVNTFSNAATTH